MDAGIDFLGFSIAGTTPQTHDSIRVNSSLAEVLSGIRLFSGQKSRKGMTSPKIHLICLMLRGNISEVPEVPRLAGELGIDQVILTNICHSINTWQEGQRVFTWGDRKSGYEGFVRRAEINARKLKVGLKRPSLSASDVAVCEEDPLRNLYISATGEVSPCVYLYPPLGSPFKRIFRGEELWLERVSFGNIFKEPLSAIWNNVEYVRFRESFMRRRKKMEDLSRSIWNGSMSQSLKNNLLSDPPEPCKTCHKILGV
jgi:MoaA/NifB/PqqE/SkfB family radical SAM enzyme